MEFKNPPKNINEMTFSELEEELQRVEVEITKVIDPTFTPQHASRLDDQRRALLERIEYIKRT